MQPARTTALLIGPGTLQRATTTPPTTSAYILIRELPLRRCGDLKDLYICRDVLDSEPGRASVVHMCKSANTRFFACPQFFSQLAQVPYQIFRLDDSLYVFKPQTFFIDFLYWPRNHFDCTTGYYRPFKRQGFHPCLLPYSWRASIYPPILSGHFRRPIQRHWGHIFTIKVPFERYVFSCRFPSARSYYPSSLPSQGVP